MLAPADGEVVSLADTLPDNPLGVKDANNPLGNHVVLRVAPDRYVFLAHMRRGIQHRDWSESRVHRNQR